VAFAVSDARSGEVLEARGAAVGAPPASVAKAVTALYALDVLGEQHRFATRIFAQGGMRNGVVEGDLWLVGGCDPTTDTRDLARLALAMKEAGVREVRGDFRVSEGPVASLRAIDPGQPDHVGYNPAVAGLALNFNRVHFEWKRAVKDFTVTMDARAGKYRPAVEMAIMEVVDRSGPVYTYADRQGRDHWTVARGALGNGGARWLPVRRPGLYAGEVFATLARSNGIVLKAPKVTRQAPQGDEVARIESAPLVDILRDMLKYSTNLTAEMVGMAATHVRTGEARNLPVSADAMNDWAIERLGMRAPVFRDHSGLSGDSRISALDMVLGLGAAERADRLRPILKPVIMLDSQGRPDRAHPVKVVAKTGTLNFVSGLAGYISTPQERDLVFAIFAADVERREAIPRAQREGPPGARPWARRARSLQRALLARWGQSYDA
jgi:D-alanyl-D-alanine carboxypeptidase/D-alanyl-D-alanine-endopeptidase (penicillin-binding protein 4)